MMRRGIKLSELGNGGGVLKDDVLLLIWQYQKGGNHDDLGAVKGNGMGRASSENYGGFNTSISDSSE